MLDATSFIRMLPSGRLRESVCSWGSTVAEERFEFIENRMRVNNLKLNDKKPPKPKTSYTVIQEHEN